MTTEASRARASAERPRPSKQQRAGSKPVARGVEADDGADGRRHAEVVERGADGHPDDRGAFGGANGAHVEAEKGLVSVEMHKRQHLSHLTLEVCEHRQISRRLLQMVLGSRTLGQGKPSYHYIANYLGVRFLTALINILFGSIPHLK